VKYFGGESNDKKKKKEKTHAALRLAGKKTLEIARDPNETRELKDTIRKRKKQAPTSTMLKEIIKDKLRR